MDFQRLELGFGKGATDRVSNADGDFNHDGVVDSLDVKIFNDQLGKSLPPAPAAPVGAPAPAPAPVITTTTPKITTTTKKVVTRTPVKTPPKPVKKLTAPPVVTKPPVRTAFTTKRLKGVGDWLETN